MRIIALCKRRPMGRDLCVDAYGRFHNLPRYLAAAGHDVHAVLMSYGSEPGREVESDGIRWSCHPLIGVGRERYISAVEEAIRLARPDWVIGFSDTYFGILAERFGSRFGISSLIDAYDNYEGYIPWCKPLHWLWRRALRRATAVTAAGPALLDLMARDRTSPHAAVVPMAVDSPWFKPLSSPQCRAELGLPEEGILVGYSGAVASNRGLDTLFRAVEILKRDRPDIRLVMSGRRVGDVAIPPDAIWLGTLPEQAVPKLINAMNVVTVVNRASKFGNYSYPIKLYEAMQCGVPAVATRTPATEWILANAPELLAVPGDPQSLADRIRYALDIGCPSYGPLPTWQDSGKKLEELLLTAGRRAE